MKPDIASVFHRHVRTGVTKNQNGFGADLLEGGVHIALERDRLAAAAALIGGDDPVARAILNPARDGLGTETAENYGMHRADAGAGEHGHRPFRDHRHVDRDPVTLRHTHFLQGVG